MRLIERENCSERDLGGCRAQEMNKRNLLFLWHKAWKDINCTCHCCVIELVKKLDVRRRKKSAEPIYVATLNYRT